MSDASKAAQFLKLANETQALLTESQAEVTRLREALAKYGTHRRDCIVTYPYAGAEPTCSCGLSAALEPTR